MGLLDVPGITTPQGDARYSPAGFARLHAAGDSQTIGSGNSALFPDIDFGDGTRAPFSTANIGTIQRGDTYLHHAALASGGQFAYGVNAGVAGDTSTGLLARFQADVIANCQPGDAVVVACMTNDIGSAGISLATSQANYKAMLAMCRTARVVMVPALILPNSGSGASRLQAISTANAWLQRWARAERLQLADFYNCGLTDPATGGLLSAYDSGDHTHPVAGGYQLMGQSLAATAIKAALVSVPLLPAHNVDPRNLLTNGLFLNDTNADGLADNWTAQAGTSTFSLSVADAKVVGKAQRIAVAGGATNFYGVAQQVFASGGKYAAGDHMVLAGVITNAALVQAQFRVTFVGSTVTTKTLVAGTSCTVTHGVEQFEFVVPPGTTGLLIALEARSGTGFCEFSQVALRNLSAETIA
jgi:lysophospholipase L1-like esterase